MKDTTDFINLTENMHISNNVVLATLDVSYLYTNIPQTEGIDIICHHYEKRYEHNLPISTNDYGNFYSKHSKRIISNLMKDTSYKHKASLWELRGQLLSLLFLRQTEKNDCQWLGPINLLFGRDLLMISFHCGTFQPKKFTSLLTSLSHSTLQISSLLDCEISSECTVFLDTEVLKAPRLSTHKIFDLQTHFKPTETFQYTHISSCHLSNCKKGKGGTLCLLRTNSLRGNFKQSK